MGIRENFISAIQRSIIISIHGPKLPHQRGQHPSWEDMDVCYVLFLTFERNSYFRQLSRIVLYGSCCCSVGLLLFLLSSPPSRPYIFDRSSYSITFRRLPIQTLDLQTEAPRELTNRLLGNVRFLGFYLVGGIASTMASLFWRRVRGDHTTSSEGASGAIYSCMGE